MTGLSFWPSVAFSCLFFPEMEGIDNKLPVARLTHQYVYIECLAVGFVDTRTVEQLLRRAPVYELKPVGGMLAKKRPQNDFGVSSVYRRKIDVLGVDDQFNGFGKMRR